LVDLDNDGRTDIVSGSWPGAISLFRRKADGTFAAPVTLKDRRGQPLDVGSASAAFAADWDGDGTLDLIVGTVTGDVYFIPNGGRTGELAFGPPRPMEANGSPIKVAGDAAPVAADWDGDGALDLVVGAEDGSVVWYRNAGTPRAPRLEAARPLIGPSPVGWGDDEKRRPGEWGLRAKPCVVDWDGDGRLDILLGDRCGGFRAKPAQSDLEKDEERRANDRLPELRRKWAAAFRTFRELAEPPAGETTAAGQERLHLREASRREMVRYKEQIATVQSIQERYQPGYQSHGFVWIFLRQPSSSTRGL
jgi:FG-GAP-like repeat